MRFSVQTLVTCSRSNTPLLGALPLARTLSHLLQTDSGPSALLLCVSSVSEQEPLAGFPVGDGAGAATKRAVASDRSAGAYAWVGAQRRGRAAPWRLLRVVLSGSGR